MLRYADRRAAAANSLAVPSQSGGPRRQQSYAPPPPQPQYVPDDDDEDTAIGTDLSAQPPIHQNVHAKFNANPVGNETYFDKDAPPDAVEPAPRPHTLAPPRPPSRQRSTSLDGRNSRPQQPMGYPYPVPPPAQYDRPPPSQYGRQNSYAPSNPPSFSYAPPPPSNAQYRRRHPQSDDESDPDSDSDDDDTAVTADDGEDSDEDAFTAVGSGVATDISEEEQQAALSGAQLGYGGYFGQQTPNGRNQPPVDHRRTVSALDGYDLQTSVRGHQQIAPNGRNITSLPVRQEREDVRMSSFQDANGRRGPPPPAAPQVNPRRTPSPEDTRKNTRSPPTYSAPAPPSVPVPTLAPPKEVPRPSSPGSGRDNTPVASYVSVPRSKPLVPEDSPEEKNLIRLLADMNFSQALKDFHDTFGLGVKKTIVAADGFGHAFCKIHCTKLPRHSDLASEPHLAQHWVPIAGNRWHFKTASHRVEIVFKSIGLGTFEATTAKRYQR